MTTLDEWAHLAIINATYLKIPSGQMFKDQKHLAGHVAAIAA
jgi:hypothetical protein